MAWLALGLSLLLLAVPGGRGKRVRFDAVAAIACALAAATFLRSFWVYPAPVAASIALAALVARLLLLKLVPVPPLAVPRLLALAAGAAAALFALFGPADGLF